MIIMILIFIVALLGIFVLLISQRKPQQIESKGILTSKNLDSIVIRLKMNNLEEQAFLLEDFQKNKNHFSEILFSKWEEMACVACEILLTNPHDEKSLQILHELKEQTHIHKQHLLESHQENIQLEDRVEKALGDLKKL